MSKYNPADCNHDVAGCLGKDRRKMKRLSAAIYLGVHYPSDVASGISLGTSWALLLAGCFSFILVPKAARYGQ
jgi:hypothetical protein